MKDGNEIVNDHLKIVPESSEHLVEVARKMLGEGEDAKENITFALQKRVLQPEQPKPPIRKESPRRAHIFHSVESVVEYLAENKSEKTVVLADVSNRSIQAVINEGAVGGLEIITFVPQAHPLFSPWATIIGKDVPVRDFAKFLQQNKRTVCSPDVQDLTMLFSQIRASQKITMHKGVGKTSINGLTCEISIQGNGQNQEVEIPDVITLDVPIYIDTPNCQIELDVILEASDTEVYVSCSSSDLDVKRIEAFEAMLKEIREINGITVGFGSINTDPWDYLRS